MTADISRNIDLLLTSPSRQSFEERVKCLRLSSALEKKAVLANRVIGQTGFSMPKLSEQDEKELSGEVLLQRHRFTELVFEEHSFRQAAISVIQNIYLFRDRRIFFSSGDVTGEAERQQALLLLTDQSNSSPPLSKTFQHNIMARIWGRIVSCGDEELLHNERFEELQQIVTNLNTIRNIYMVLTTGLVSNLTRHVNKLYRQSVTREDAHQIGSIGVAKASYRYHYRTGRRFAAYASHWVKKEVQRQALDGRLIKISTNLIEKISAAARSGDCEAEKTMNASLEKATSYLLDHHAMAAISENRSEEFDNPVETVESDDMHKLLESAIENVLSQKTGDVIRRRYGLSPYCGNEQSVIDIANTYGVSRGSIYQLESSGLQKLGKHLSLQLS